MVYSQAKVKTHKDLDVYKRSYNLTIKIYKFTFSLPKYLQYDIADDLRRAARSIPSNLAEGYGRNKSIKDIITFIKTSRGSCDREDYKYFSEEYTICGNQLTKLLSSLKNQSTRNQ